MALYGLTLYILTDSPIQINAIRMELLRGHRSEFPNYDVLKSLKIVLTSAKSAEPDEMQLYAAFHLGLHCLQKYPFKGFQNTKG